MLPPKPLDPSVIDNAPDETPEAERELVPTEQRRFSEYASLLQVELASAQARIEELSAEVDLDAVKARLARPYANKVFRFLCTYCIGIFVVVLLDGFHVWGFSLDATVLSVLGGSTAVAAIGLVHAVVKGLFGPARRISTT